MNLRSIFGWAAFLFFLSTGILSAQVITNVVPPLASHGTVVDIYGSGFAPGGRAPNSLSVDFNGTISTTWTNAAVSDSHINITNVPASATSGFIHVYINGNEAISPQPFVIISSNAYVTNIAPISGGNGTPVTVWGVNFLSGGATNVTFNGLLAQGTPNIKLNSIAVTAPNGVTTGPLVVLSKYGSSHNFSTATNVFYAATNFFVAPKIVSFSPTNGRPDTNVLIIGTNFTAASSVTFGSVSALSFIVLSNTAIQATVPTNTSTGKITVYPPSVSPPLSSGASAINFSMLPTIYGFSPGSGTVGTTVTVNGAGLNEQSPHPTVTVGGDTGTVTTFGTIGANSLSFNVPASASSGPIAISTTNGSIASSQIFYLPPSISSFTPSGGGAGAIVQINGSNFTNATAVTFNGLAAAGFSVTNNSVIGAIVPSGVTSGTISVTTPGGVATSAGVFLGAPSIASFTPTHGSPGTNVTITGLNFTNTTAVLFNGVGAASFVVTNNTTIGAVVPSGATTGPITVQSPGGTNTSAANFTIDSADIGVSVTALPDPVFVGSNLVYTIIVTNIGPVSASNVRLTNTLATGVTFKSATTTQGAVGGGNPVVGALGAINNGASATVTLTVTSAVIGSITNMARVSSDLSDPNPANNTSITTTTVWPLPFLSIANLMSNNLVQVTWPAPLSGFTLQFTPGLSTNISWTNDAGSKVVSGTNVSVVESNIGSARFFRLTN